MRAIQVLKERRTLKAIADADEIDACLIALLLDPNQDRFVRLGAAKELSKVWGRDSIHHLHEGKLTLEQILVQIAKHEEAARP